MASFIVQNSWWLIPLLIAWTLPWEVIALWKAARNNDKPWFVVLLIVNSLAVLEIAYIFFFSKRQKQQK